MADILGTNGNDTIDGTAGDDLITGGAGNDTIEAGAGNDTLIGDGGSAGGTGSSGTILGDGPGSTGGGYDRVYAQSVYNGNHSFSTDAFYLGNDIPVLDDANRNAITGVSFSQDGEGTDRTFGLDELTFTGAQRSYVGLVTVQDSDVHGANDQFSSSISGGFQDTTVVSSGTADFTMNDGQVFQGIRVNFVRGPDGETYMMPDDGPSPYAFNAFRNMLATNDSGIKSFTIATGSGDDAGINPIEGNWADGQFAEITNPPVGDSFDDVLCGDEGDDIIYGDGGDSATAAGFGVAGGLLGDGPGSTGGGYDRVYAQSVYNGNHSFSTDAFYLGNDIPVLDDANRNAITGVSFSQDGEGTDRTFGLDELEFTGAQRSYVGLVTVQNVDVHNANDQFSSSISGGFQDVQVVSSGTADFTMNDGQVFQGIRVNFVRGPDGETYMMPDDGPSPYAFNAFRNMLATNDSGIKSFTIATGSGDDAGINPIEGNWADGQFKVTQDGEGGDDIIKGGAGSDTMFGEGGDDTFLVTTASDAAGDIVVGGNGPDQTADNDVLDLTGAGLVTIDEEADETDEGATRGTVTFEDGSTLQFSQIEEIIRETITLTITPDDIGIDADGRPELTENGPIGSLLITRSGPTDDPLVVTLSSDDTGEAIVPATVTIPSGASSIDVQISPVDDLLIDGPQFPIITASVPGAAPVSVEVRVNDDDLPTLTLTPVPGAPTDPATGNPLTAENGAPAQIVISRDGPVDQDLVVTLTDGDPTETDAPATVTIPAGSSSVTVDIPSVDDTDVDGPQISTITATAPGTNPGSIDVTVADDDLPTLTLTPVPGAPTDPATGNPLTAENGAPAQIVISRDGPVDQDLVVTLTDGDPTETDAPATVTIPAGSSSVTVDIPSVDDTDVDGPQISTITATAPGTNPGSIDVTVADDDVAINLVFTPDDIGIDPDGRPVLVENGPSGSLLITRDGSTAEDLVVTLSSDDTSEAIVPATVTIPAGSNAIDVLVTPVDDLDIDGPQFPTITATAPGAITATVEVRVNDDDLPTITIAPDPSATLDPDGRPVLVENGDPVNIVISRDGPLDQPLVVTLDSDDPTEATVPTTVTIPAGQPSITVPVTPVDDPDVDGPQFPTITAAAPGVNSGTIDVVVQDDDLPTLTITPAPGAPADPLTGNPLTAENGAPAQIVISRDGPVDEDLVVTLTDGDPTETDAPATVTILAGQSSVTVDIPSVDDTDVDGDQISTITATAPGANPGSIDVTVADDDVAAPKGTVSGRVWCDEDEDGIEDPLEPGVGGVTVQLRDADNGFVTVATAVTDAGGRYSFTNVEPGNYCVFFEDEDPGTIWTAKGVGGFATDSNVIEAFQNGPGETDIFMVVPGGNVKDIDGGVIKISANAPPVAGDDREGPISNGDLLDGNGKPVEITASNNALANDFDPDGDTIEIISFGTDTTADGDGWFDWQDGSSGGELRLNLDGTFEFRDIAGDFEELGSGQSVETGLEYLISDGNGETDAATITVEIEGQDCGCTGPGTPPALPSFEPMDM